MNSAFTTHRVVTWCPVWVFIWVAFPWLLHMSTSPSRKTRSQGTSTSSKKTTASISSKREPKGWSKWDRPWSRLSRHMNLTPGVSQGMEKEKA